MKIICVTWGVYSGLGKGIAGASIGRLMKSAGYSVGMVKIDPYLHVDAGTMNPYSHGEVFVTEDGAETDLDLGHYERFLSENMSEDSSITSGKVYRDVITRERNGEFLGQNVQVIPHITDNIKKRICKVAEKYDITIVEIGGTVGDIESPAFFEAMRQMKREIGRDNVCYVHLAPIVYIPWTEEEKTKPIQHSITELRATGLQPDILICRNAKPLGEGIKRKLSLLCDIDEEAIFTGDQVQSIYEVPINFAKQWLHTVVADKINLNIDAFDLSDREARVENIIHPKKEITIALIGKYNEMNDCDLSVMEALKHAGANNSTKVYIHSIQPCGLESEHRRSLLDGVRHDGQLDGILIPGWFGSRWTEGMMNAIRYARENNIPLLGLCFGLQLSVIEFARNVCHITEANSLEIHPETEHPVVTIMEGQKDIDQKWGTMRLGAYPAKLTPGSRVAEIYGTTDISERHRHRYEVNPKYHQQLEENGLSLSGKSPDGQLVEFIEISDHPFFIATQAHPELKSKFDNPHPIFNAFVKIISEEKK